MREFSKDGGIKRLSDNHKLIPLLIENGWIETSAKRDDVASPSKEMDREALVLIAQEIGLAFHHRVGAKKLAEMIEEAKANGNRS